MTLKDFVNRDINIRHYGHKASQEFRKMLETGGKYINFKIQNKKSPNLNKY